MVTRSEVKVGGQVGEGSRLGGPGRGSRSGEGSRFGFKVGVNVRGQGRAVMVRVMIGGHKVWSQGGGQY